MLEVSFNICPSSAVPTYWYKSKALKSWRKFWVWHWPLFPDELHCGVRQGQCPYICSPAPTCLSREESSTFLPEECKPRYSVQRRELNSGLGRGLTMWTFTKSPRFQPLLSLPLNLVFLGRLFFNFRKLIESFQKILKFIASSLFSRMIFEACKLDLKNMFSYCSLLGTMLKGVIKLLKSSIAQELGHVGWHFHIPALKGLYGAGENTLWDCIGGPGTPCVLLSWGHKDRLFGEITFISKIWVC